MIQKHRINRFNKKYVHKIAVTFQIRNYNGRLATSRPLDLFRLNRFESYYKFTREKMIDIMLCRERRQISPTVLLVNCHDVTRRIFDR